MRMSAEPLPIRRAYVSTLIVEKYVMPRTEIHPTHKVELVAASCQEDDWQCSQCGRNDFFKDGEAALRLPCEAALKTR